MPALLCRSSSTCASHLTHVSCASRVTWCLCACMLAYMNGSRAARRTSIHSTCRRQPPSLSFRFHTIHVNHFVVQEACTREWVERQSTNHSRRALQAIAPCIVAVCDSHPRLLRHEFAALAQTHTSPGRLLPFFSVAVLVHLPVLHLAGTFSRRRPCLGNVVLYSSLLSCVHTDGVVASLSTGATLFSCAACACRCVCVCVCAASLFSLTHPAFPRLPVVLADALEACARNSYPR